MDKAEDTHTPCYFFVLFVIKDAENSKRAQTNLERLCEKWLAGKYQIDVVDVVDDFQSALDYNILLTPSVVVKHPEPQLTIHGDLSDPQNFIDALNLDQE